MSESSKFPTSWTFEIQVLKLVLFVWFVSLCPINNLSVIKGRVFLGWTSTKLGLMFLLKNTTQWHWWGSNQQPLCLQSSTLPLSSLLKRVVCQQIINNFKLNGQMSLDRLKIKQWNYYGLLNSAFWGWLSVDSGIILKTYTHAFFMLL